MKSFLTGALLATALITNNPAYAEQSNAPEFSLSQLQGSFPYIEIERSLDKLDSPFYTIQPQHRNDGVVVGKHPNTASFITLARQIAAGEHADYDSMLIAHQNTLVFESYYAYGRVDLPHYQASATKGYTSLAIGRAIELGYLSMQDLNKPVLSFLTDIETENLVTGVDKITLHHTLSMRSGIRISDEIQQVLESDPKQVAGQKLAQAYFTTSAPITDANQVYYYQPIDTIITMLVLDSVVPGSAQEFIEAELINKLGIKRYLWEQNVSGVPEAAFGTSMTSRDMLKWATLLKDNGMWQGEPLISSEFITQATGSVAIPTDDEWDYTGYRYGYYFWGKTLQVGDRKFNANLAWGGGTQMAIAIPSAELVIIITARARAAGFETMDLIEQKILPVFVG